jgi:hypothetical protein
MALEMTEAGVGLELIERKISLILFNELNDEIDLQQEKWVDRDSEWNILTGQEPSYVEVEHVEPNNFYQGHKPSIVKNAPIAKFPNVSVMVYQARPLTSVIDQASNFSVTVDIEMMVKGENEYVVNARVHRSVEAVHQVLVRNDKLGGLSFGWDNDPIIQITDIFSRKENTSHGEDWLWSASRIRYNLSRHARLPQNS